MSNATMTLSPRPRIASRFDESSTVAQVIAGHNLSGKAAIVTGGASGIGLEVVRALATAGAQVCIAARNIVAAREAATRINRTLPGERVTVAELDLADLSSVHAFCRGWGHTPLQFLINNAGVMASSERTTRDGFEMQFGTNHLGHFLLAVLLVPALKASAPSRVVSVSSSGHVRTSVDFADPHFRNRPYDHLMAYTQSKTANALFAVEFDRLHRDIGIRAFSVMPGMIETRLLRNIVTDDLAAQFGLKAKDGDSTPLGPPPVFRSAEQGAATIVWAAVSEDLEGAGGLYLHDCAEAPPYRPDLPRGHGVHPHALDPASAQRLWALSLAEVGLAKPG